MSSRERIIEEFEDAMAGRAIGYRADALCRVNDLFLSVSATHSEHEIALFDDVMVRLAEEIETSMRAEIARRLAKIPNAPRNLIRKLATDEAIEVAGPVLRGSDRLDDEVMVVHAKTASQDHLLAISQRIAVSESVTDVLVERGDRTVALSTVGNAGARFSDKGHTILVERSRLDGELAAGIWSRPDVPRQHLLKLFNTASDNVRRTLEAADPKKSNLIREVVNDVTNQFRARTRSQSRDYSLANRAVTDLHQAGELDEDKLKEFAAARAFDETTVALSILCDLPIGACERAMVQDRAELLLLLLKAIGLSWETTKAILLARAGPCGMSMHEWEQHLASFSRLRQESADKALRYLRLRERASVVQANGPSEQR
jgi:uncharacterized protein (DUF2336 family)